MSLRDVIESVEGREKRLTVFDPPSDAAVAELREYFASQQVRIEVGESDSSLAGYAVLSDADDDAVLAAVDLADLDGPLTADVGETRAFSPLLEHLDDATFTSYDPEQMLAATREMEDRAWRTGAGELHAGFQRTAALRAQTGVYEDLARKRLDIHVYCVPAPDVPAVEGVTVHWEDTPEIRSFLVRLRRGRRPERRLRPARGGAGRPRRAFLLRLLDVRPHRRRPRARPPPRPVPRRRLTAGSGVLRPPGAARYRRTSNPDSPSGSTYSTATSSTSAASLPV